MKKHYIENEELINLIEQYKSTCKKNENGKYIQGSGHMSERLGEAILMIARGLAQKGCWNGYTWIEDMIAEGVLTVCKYLHNFNKEKSNNAFAYITMICRRAFVVYKNEQKIHSEIKDTLIKQALAEGYIPNGEDE